MKTQRVFLGAALALPLVGTVLLGLLGTGDPQVRFQVTAAVVILSLGVFLLAYAAFQRFVLGGPSDEFWITLVVAVGGAAPGYRMAAGVSLQSVAGLALALGGPALFIVGMILSLRARRARRARGLLAE